MKKNLMIATAILAGFFLASCNKEGVQLFQGRYGYNMSGSLLCQTVVSSAASADSVVNVNFSLCDEQGVLHLEPHGDMMVMTMKDIAGSVTVYDATVSGSTINVLPLQRRVKINTESGTLVTGIKSLNVLSSGNGYKTNGLMVIDMKCNGDDFFLVNGTDTTWYKIVGSSIKCVATE